MTTQYIKYPSTGVSAFWGDAVANFAALPPNGTVGEVRQTLNDKELWTWDGSAWVGVQPPNSVMEWKGTWSAATNTPTLADGVGNTGDVYACIAAGTVNFGSGPITFSVGDWVIYSGSVWERVVNSNAVVSVNGKTGAVTLEYADFASNSALTIQDAFLEIQDNGDITKRIKWQLSNMSTGVLATFSPPALTSNATVVLVGTQQTQTISNKTFPASNSFVLQTDKFSFHQDSGSDLTYDLTGLTANRVATWPDADLTVVGTTTTQTLTNKTISTTNTVKQLDSNFEIWDDADNSRRFRFDATNVPTSTTVTFGVPNADTTLVGTNTSQTLTNKIISGASNTISNVSLTTGVTDVLPMANGGTNKNMTPVAGGIVWTDADSQEVSAAGTTGQVLHSGGTGAPTWSQIVNADVSPSAAIEGSKIALADTSGNAGVVNPYTTNGVVYSGTFTPTVSASTNVSGTPTVALSYTRVGVIVTCAFSSVVTPTAAASTVTSIDFDLPVATANFSAQTEVLGCATAVRASATAAAAPAFVGAVATTQRVRTTFLSPTTSAINVSGTFQYEIQ